MAEPLTDAQVENWRRILCSQIGPYALMMTRDQIQTVRDRVAKEIEMSFPAQRDCVCDRSYYGQTVHVDGRVTCNHCHHERVDKYE